MSKFGFDKVIAKLQQEKIDLPRILAIATQKFFTDSWSKQGWDDGGVKSWKPRAKETKKTEGKAILVGTGKLRRAVATSLRSATFEQIKFVIDDEKLNYATYINEGTDKMPKRKFMGDSKTLRDIQEKKINLALKKIWPA